MYVWSLFILGKAIALRRETAALDALRSAGVAFQPVNTIAAIAAPNRVLCGREVVVGVMDIFAEDTIGTGKAQTKLEPRASETVSRVGAQTFLSALRSQRHPDALWQSSSTPSNPQISQTPSQLGRVGGQLGLWPTSGTLRQSRFSVSSPIGGQSTDGAPAPSAAVLRQSVRH